MSRVSRIRTHYLTTIRPYHQEARIRLHLVVLEATTQIIHIHRIFQDHQVLRNLITIHPQLRAAKIRLQLVVLEATSQIIHIHQKFQDHQGLRNLRR